MFHRTLFVRLLLLMTVATPFLDVRSSIADEIPSDPGELRRVASVAWEEYLEDFPYVAIEVAEYRDVGDTRDAMTQEYAREPWFTVLYTAAGVGLQEHGENENMKAANTTYGFNLKGTEVDPLLQSVGESEAFRGLEVQSINPAVSTTNSYVGGLILNGLFIGRGVTVSGLFDDPLFIIHEVSPEENGLVAFTFSYEPPDDRRFLRTGRVVLDPNRYWLMASASLNVKTDKDGDGDHDDGDGYCEVECSYGEFERMPVLLERHQWHDEGRGILHHRRSYTYRVPTENDRERLFLTYYGIPEPAFDNSSGRWMIIVGIILLACGVVWWVVHRIRASHA